MYKANSFCLYFPHPYDFNLQVIVLSDNFPSTLTDVFTSAGIAMSVLFLTFFTVMSGLLDFISLSMRIGMFQRK